jgi:nucleotide-binding universal stress UspA family protein
VSSNTPPAPWLVAFQERNATGQHNHQQPSAAVVLIGSHGRGDLTALLLGSMAHKVIHLADRPVLVAR